MTPKKPRRLLLSRESLRRLSPDTLDGVHGGKAVPATWACSLLVPCGATNPCVSVTNCNECNTLTHCPG